MTEKHHMTKLTKRQQVILWYANHAGYCTPPGRLACAKALADAKAAAERAGYTWEWEYDPEPWDHDADDDYEPTEVLCCVMRDPRGRVVGSCGGIADPNADYRLIIEAELATEVF